MYGSLRSRDFSFSILSLLPYRGRQDADRPIDDIGQDDVPGKSELGRQSLLSFMGPDLVTARGRTGACTSPTFIPPHCGASPNSLLPVLPKPVTPSPSTSRWIRTKISRLPGSLRGSGHLRSRPSRNTRRGSRSFRIRPRPRSRGLELFKGKGTLR